MAKSLKASTKVHLDLTGLKALVKRLEKAEETVIQVGHFEGKIHKSARNTKHYTMAELSAVQQFGVPKTAKNPEIPARPYMMRTARDKKRVFRKDTRKMVRQIVLGKTTFAKESADIGRSLRDGMKNTMRSWSEPFNSSTTIAKKGSNRPLTESYQLLNDIKYRTKRNATGLLRRVV